MATLYLDFSGGNDANDATSFANRVKTVTSGITAARHTAGDTIRMMKSEDPVSLGISATWTNKSNTVTLASALTTNIYLDGAWTASTNVTCTTSTTRKEGSNSSSNAFASAFTTGKASYFATGTLDLSTKNKISFWIRANGAVASGVLRIDLCSDTAGATPVNSLTINEALTTNNWKCITIDNGAGLGASIQSVALYCVSDPGTVTILLDNIIACNDLTLTCLISKNSSATSKEFYPIQSINGTTVKLDYAPDSGAADAILGYYGTTETVTTYKREPIRIVATNQQVQEAGTASNPSTFSGGWDTSNMTTQNGLTFIDVGDDSVAMITSADFINYERIVTVRGLYGFNITNNQHNYINDCAVICKGSSNTAQGGFHINAGYTKITNCAVYSCAGYGFTTRTASVFMHVEGITALGCQSGGMLMFDTGASLLMKDLTFNNNGNGLLLDSSVVALQNLTVRDNQQYGVAANNTVRLEVVGLTSSGNTSGAVLGVSGSLYLFDNTDCSEATPFNPSSGGRIHVSRIGGDPAVWRIYDKSSSPIVAQPDTGTVHGSTTTSIKHSPQTSHVAGFPFVHKVFPFAIDSTGTLTVSVYVRRSNSSNVGAKLVVRGGQVDGVTTDQTDDASAASNTWEQLTVTCSPTEKVPIEIELHSWQTAGGGDIYWGDFSVSQS
jgi:hypothetical protein